MAGGFKGRRDEYKRRKKRQQGILNQFLSDWQDRQVHCLRILKYAAPVFNRDIERLREIVSLDAPQKAAHIIKKYSKFGLRPYAVNLVAHYIEKDEVNPLVMLPAAIAVSTKENIAGPAIAYNDGKKLKDELDAELVRNPNERVYLIIHPDAKKEDLLEWINGNYDFFLKERLEKLDPTRPKRTKTPDPENLKRDMALYEHIIVKGLPVADIAGEYGLNEVEARKYAKAIENKIGDPGL